MAREVVRREGQQDTADCGSGKELAWKIGAFGAPGGEDAPWGSIPGCGPEIVFSQQRTCPRSQSGKWAVTLA